MTKRICLAGGCFWGAEHYLKRIHGVVSTEVGFANGSTPAPTYKQVYTDTTGYAEAVMVEYDPDQLSLVFLLEMYFRAIDPCSVNRQGEDSGTRYRTGIYWLDEADIPAIRYVYEAEARRSGALPVWCQESDDADGKPRFAVELEPLSNFFPAEDYHQDYLDRNPDGYCHLPQELFSMAKGIRCPMRRVRDFLETNGLAYDIHFHPPLFTIAEALEYWKDIDAVHCKNLFMRNHKGNRHYLISFECHKDLDIHGLEHSLHQGKLSFASPERMSRCLGLRPGSVSPFGLINDIDLSGADPKELFENGHRVKLYLDAALQTAERISFHPCDNTASVVVTNDVFMRFLELWGGECEFIDFE